MLDKMALGDVTFRVLRLPHSVPLYQFSTFIHSFIHLLIHSFIHSVSQPFSHSFINSVVN